MGDVLARTVVLVGTGQLGRLFGAGLLAGGRTVVPVRRGEPLPPGLPELVLVAVGEDDLADVLAALPASQRDRVALLQNELSPGDWQRHGVVRPTVAVVWSEKKAGKSLAVVRDTEVAGPHAATILAALRAVDVPAVELAEGAALEDALVVKNLYILVSNFAGLRGVTTVGELLGAQRPLADALADEVLAIENARLGRPAAEVVLDRMRAAFAADPKHGCRGRTSEARLARTLERARSLGVATPELDALHARSRGIGS